MKKLQKSSPKNYIDNKNMAKKIMMKAIMKKLKMIIKTVNYIKKIQMVLQMSQIRIQIQLEKLIETISQISICLNQC